MSVVRRYFAPPVPATIARPARSIYYWLSLLLVCLLPVQRFMLPFGLSLADAVMAVLIVVTLERTWRTGQSLTFPLLLPMWLILTASTVATLVGLQHMDSAIALLQEIYLFIAFLTLVNLWRTLTIRDLNRLMKVWVIVATAEALLAVAGMLRIGPSILYTKPSQDMSAEYEIVRAVGVHANANAAAVYLSVSFFVALATRWSKPVRAILAAILFAGVFATGSNGALLSLIVGVGLLILASSIAQGQRRGLLWAGFACLFIVGASLMVLFAQELVALLPGGLVGAREPLFFQTAGRFVHSLQNRISIVDWAWDIYRRFPWGIGPNAFSTIHGSLHNDYAAFWFERGHLGLVGWLWLIAETAVRPLRGIRKPAAVPSWQVLTLWAGFLATMLNAFSHEVSHMRQVWFLMALLFALSLQRADWLEAGREHAATKGEPRWPAPARKALTEA